MGKGEGKDEDELNATLPEGNALASLSSHKSYMTAEKKHDDYYLNQIHLLPPFTERASGVIWVC